MRGQQKGGCLSAIFGICFVDGVDVGVVREIGEAFDCRGDGFIDGGIWKFGKHQGLGIEKFLIRGNLSLNIRCE